MSTSRKPKKALVRDENLGVSYARFSDEKQDSITDQNGINSEIAVEESVRLVALFEDPALSRSLSDRPGLLAMFAYLEAHPEVGFIVVNELERLTAGLGQRMKVIELCQRLRITILTEDIGRIDPFDEEKMYQADRRALDASGEVMKIRRRVRRSLRMKVVAGTVAMRPAFGTRMKPILGPDGRPLPKGIRMVDANGRKVSSGVLEVEPDELPWLIKMFNWADERKGFDEIARLLTSLGVPTKSGRGSWRGNTVRGIITNPLYKGEMTWGLQATVRDGVTGRSRLEVRDEDDPGRITKPSPLGPLVDPVVWDRVNARIEARVNSLHSRTRNRPAKELHIFDGYVWCARCGHRMYGRQDATRRADGTRPPDSFRYFCYSARPGWVQKEGFGPLCQRAHTIMEKSIINMLERIGTPGFPASSYVTFGAGPDNELARQSLKREIDASVTEQERALSMTLKGLLDEDRYAVEKLRLESQVAELQTRYDALVPVSPPSTSAAKSPVSYAVLAGLLRNPDLSVETRRSVLAEARFERILIDGPLIKINLLAG